MNIFILGRASGSYRTQNFIKLNLDYSNNHIYFDDFTIEPKSKIKFVRIISRLLHFIFKDISSLYKLFTCDIVYVSAMNHSNLLLKFSKIIKKTILTEFYISLYDTYVNDRKTLDKNTHRAKYLITVDKIALANSNVVIFLNESEAKYYTNVIGYELNKINYRIIPLCVNERKPVNMPFLKFGKDYVNLCWWGTYIPLHGLDKILRAMKSLKEKGFLCKLYMFGDSEIKAIEYHNLIKEYCIEDIVHINNTFNFKNRELDKFLENNCDIALGTFGDSEKAKTVIANKIIDAISMHAPVVTGYTSGISEYFDGVNDIFIINNTVDDLVNKIIEISQMDYDLIYQRIENAYNIYKKFFSVESFNKEMQTLLLELEDHCKAY